MSAYVVSEKQMIVCAVAIQCYGKDDFYIEWNIPIIKELVQEINRANNFAVDYRYNNVLCNNVLLDVKLPTKWKLIDLYRKFSKVELLKLLDNLNYQCDESSSWDATTLANRISSVRTKIALDIVRNSEEYDKAAWGLGQ